jgi:tetratricopeptide (TPR) repeat protein
MRVTRQVFLIVVLFSAWCCSFELFGQEATKADEKYAQAGKLRYVDYNQTLKLLEEVSNEYLSLGDTLKSIKILREMAFINGHHAKYKVSYDCLWKSLSLANAWGNQKLVASLYVDIGRYYGFYKRQKETFGFLNKSLELKKELIKKSNAPKSILIESYYALCAVNREFNDFVKAKIYLDSCYQFYDKNNIIVNLAGLQFEEAVIMSNTGKVTQAISLFEKVKEWYTVHNPAYNVLVETYQGLAFQQNGQLNEAEVNFRKALAISEKYDSHRDFANLIHEYLSNIYFKKGNLALAYEELKKVKELDMLFFDSRSENNRGLLEIQDQFRVEQDKAEALLQKQKLKELEASKQIFFLQRSILIIAIVFLFALGYLYIKYLRNKHKAEKQIAKRNQELEMQKANELIEIKNREMAVSSLKLIEKEEIIDEFKSSLEKSNWEVEPAKLKRALKSLEVNHNQNWEEFETRFISINSQFYENLHAKFPDLTSGDDKLCALIKLNFTSKDMSKLLGISIESVHTSRYRLRKKLGLERDDNLTDFISKF